MIVHGLTRLHPTYVTKRFTSLRGRPYSPDVLDDKFRTLMKTGLFNTLKIEPAPIENEDKLLLDISAEEAKSKEVGFSLGYGTYEGIIVGAQYRERDLFGTGRPLTTSVEVSQREYKGEVDYEDPYLFDTDLDFKNRIYALTFDYDGYTKFELGDRVELTRHFTKHYEAGIVFAARQVEAQVVKQRPVVCLAQFVHLQHHVARTPHPVEVHLRRLDHRRPLDALEASKASA